MRKLRHFTLLLVNKSLGVWLSLTASVDHEAEVLAIVGKEDVHPGVSTLSGSIVLLSFCTFPVRVPLSAALKPAAASASLCV